MNLCEKYSPKTWGDIRGQSAAVRVLRHYAEGLLSGERPRPLLLTGASGIGKSAAAYVLARALGVDVDAPADGACGGLYRIASGEQDARSVRNVQSAAQYTPLMGSGWRVVVVNEADSMTPNAALCWLDALEMLGRQKWRVVVVFTANSTAFDRRFEKRCMHVRFEGRAEVLLADVQAYANELWELETGGNHCPVDALSLVDADGEIGFRDAADAVGYALLAREE